MINKDDRNADCDFNHMFDSFNHSYQICHFEFSESITRFNEIE